MRDRMAVSWRPLSIAFVLLLGTVISAPGRADVIDFESGFIDRDEVTGPIVTSTNAVRFRFGAGSPTYNGFITRVGSPTTAFFPHDLPTGGSPGAFLLSDELAPRGNPQSAMDYFIEFAEPVSNLSLELYDLEIAGNTATLTAYSDLTRTDVVGMDSATIVGNAPEGLVTPLSIPNPTTVIRVASLTLSNGSDLGTGIDNVTFTTARVPIPTAALLAIALLLFGTSFVALRRA